MVSFLIFLLLILILGFSFPLLGHCNGLRAEDGSAYRQTGKWPIRFHECH